MTDSVDIRQIFFFEFFSLQVLSSFFSPLLSQFWSKPFQVIRRSLGSIDGGKSTRINNTSGIITSPEVQFLLLANCIDVDLGHLSPTPPSFLPSSDYTETKDTVQRKHNCVSRQTLQLQLPSALRLFDFPRISRIYRAWRMKIVILVEQRFLKRLDTFYGWRKIYIVNFERLRFLQTIEIFYNYYP